MDTIPRIVSEQLTNEESLNTDLKVVKLEPLSFKFIFKDLKGAYPKNIIAPNNSDWKREWIPATATRNYMLRDPLLDWLQYNFKDTSQYKPHNIKETKDTNSFVKYIMNQGHIFEEKVIELIIKRFGNDVFIKIDTNHNSKDVSKVIETFNAMKKGIPIIHSGLLHNPHNKTYGIPDLIVRSDWVNRLVSTPVLNNDEIHNPAINLHTNYHYVIIDIKFSSLCLKADGIHLLNSGSFPAYKSQLYIYNIALANLQGYNPQKAYILGRRWRYASKGCFYKNDSCFDRLGTIDYLSHDNMYIKKTDDALRWLRDVRSDESGKWNIYNTPLTRKELYPNMSNTHDYPWHNIKEHISKNIKELTELWMVGTKNREIAHSQGVYKWTDRRCTPEVLGIKGEYTRSLLRSIININRPDNKEVICPKIIQNNFCDWQNKKILEFYIDFETINDVLTDFKNLPHTDDNNMIFMIGVGFIDPDTGIWIYKDFTVDILLPKDEANVCDQFYRYIKSMCDKYNITNVLCIHWAQAENTLWNNAIKRHKTEEWNIEKIGIWFDMLRLFKDEGIVIKGALSYNLKEIAKAFHNQGYIPTVWNTENTCVNGRGAMISVWKANNEALKLNRSLKDISLIEDIRKYNEVDVKVLYEIMNYLRENHTLKERAKRKRDTIDKRSKKIKLSE